MFLTGLENGRLSPVASGAGRLEESGKPFGQSYNAKLMLLGNLTGRHTLSMAPLSERINVRLALVEVSIMKL